MSSNACRRCHHFHRQIDPRANHDVILLQFYSPVTTSGRCMEDVGLSVGIFCGWSLFWCDIARAMTPFSKMERCFPLTTVASLPASGFYPTTMTTLHDLGDLEARTEAAQRRWFSRQATVHGNDEGTPQAKKRQGEAEDAEYGDSSATYWNLYTSEAEINDQKLVETLAGDTNSLMFLNSIFSAIIAAFIIETYKALQPDNNQETVCLLSQLVSQENSSQRPSRFCPSPYPEGPSAAVIRSNILLVLSFFLAMMSALACTLIQLWCREYTKYASPRVAPHKRGRVRTYLFQGLERFEMRRFMYGVHFLLHTSVFLFFCGVSDYLHDAYPRVGMISWCCVGALTVVYSALSIAPLIIGNCPYQTALTPPLQFGYRLLFFPGRAIWWLWDGTKATFPGRKDLHFNKSHFLVEEANKKAAHLDPYAMEWLFTENDFSDTDMDKFLVGLPGYIDSLLTAAEDLPKVRTAPYIRRRIREHLFTCASASELSEQARVKPPGNPKTKTRKKKSHYETT
ncbi:hypothetical protein EDB87DRAFT_1279522 [Lactarius vividus]|nr:hypothetical protein EDB87DRAFT_1279522 [Lactarius vividus]